MLKDIILALIEDEEIKHNLAEYIKSQTSDAEDAWEEIWCMPDVVDTWANTFARAMWNTEYGVCVLTISPYAYWHIQTSDMPPTREAQVFNSYTDAIEWARNRLPEMWSACEKYKEKQHGH